MTLAALGEEDRLRLSQGEGIRFNRDEEAILGVVIHPIIRSVSNTLISDSFLLLRTDATVPIPPYNYVLFDSLANGQSALEPVIRDQLRVRSALEMLYTIDDPNIRHDLADATLELQQTAVDLRIQTTSKILSLESIAVPVDKALSAFSDDEYVKKPGSTHSPMAVFLVK